MLLFTWISGLPGQRIGEVELAAKEVRFREDREGEGKLARQVEKKAKK
jgi:hypothetical protein